MSNKSGGHFISFLRIREKSFSPTHSFCVVFKRTDMNVEQERRSRTKSVGALMQRGLPRLSQRIQRNY